MKDIPSIFLVAMVGCVCALVAQMALEVRPLALLVLGLSLGYVLTGGPLPRLI